MLSKVVLTGGPCAGKTHCLRAIRARYGSQVVTLPESATLVLDSGIPPPGHERIHVSQDEWVRSFQGAILGLQQTVEDVAEPLARRCGARLIVCDRGVLDGAAYWPGGRQAFLEYFALTADECFARYQRVLHLQSLAVAQPHLYGPQNNSIRYESTIEAVGVERSIRAAWQGHPGLILVPAEAELERKIARVLEHIGEWLGMH